MSTAKRKGPNVHALMREAATSSHREYEWSQVNDGTWRLSDGRGEEAIHVYVDVTDVGATLRVQWRQGTAATLAPAGLHPVSEGAEAAFAHAEKVFNEAKASRGGESNSEST